MASEDEDRGAVGGVAACREPEGRRGRDPELRSLSAPWRHGIVLVCRDCGRGGRSRKLVRRLQEDLADAGLRKRTRVVEVECMSLCPKQSRIAVALPGGTLAAVRPSKERAEVVRFLCDRIPV